MTGSTPPASSTSDRRSRRIVAVIAIGLAVAAFAYLAMGDLGENLVYYYSPSEILAQENVVGAAVRLGGLVAADSVVTGADGLDLEFVVTDGEAAVPVVARTVPPAMFREGIGVVLEGNLRADGVFETNRLMVKHDNEYRAPEDGKEKSMEELLKTMQFDTSNT